MNTSESSWNDVIEAVNHLYESHFEDEDAPNKNITERVKCITRLFDDVWEDKYELTPTELYFFRSLCALYKFKAENRCQFENNNLTRLFLNLYEALQTTLIHMKRRRNFQ